jgi:hypothetical protein
MYYLLSVSCLDVFGRDKYLVTSIAHRVVANVTTRSKQSLGNLIKLSILNSWGESMLGVMTMLGENMAGNAKVEVCTARAGYKVPLGEFCKD